MKDLKDAETQLRNFIAGHQHDQVVDPLQARALSLEAQQLAAKQQLSATRQIAADAMLAAQERLVAGEKVDNAPLGELRAAVRESEETVELLDKALEQLRRDIVRAKADRADRDAATLTPIFQRLMALADERAEALAEVTAVLDLAHRAAASSVSPVSVVAQGWAGLFNRERLTRWRQRASDAGLLKRERVGQRVVA